MIGDDAQGRLNLGIALVDIRKASRFADERLKQIRIEIADFALQNGGDALKTRCLYRWKASAAARPCRTASRLNCMKTRFQIST